MPSPGAASAFWSCTFPQVFFIFFLPFALFMGERHQKSGPRQQISPSSCQDHQIFLSLKPKANPLFPASLIFPNLDAWFIGMFDGRLRPADSLTTPEIDQPFVLIFPLREHVPECSLLPLRQRMPFQAQALTFENRLAVNEIDFEERIEGFEVAVPISSIGFKKNQFRQPGSSAHCRHLSEACQTKRLVFSSRSNVV